MRRILIPLLFFLFFFIFSVSVKAYEIFNQNPYFTTNNNGYYIADSFSNSSCFFWWCWNNTYSCFDVQNINGSLVLSNSSRCNFNLNYNFAAITIKMLSDDSYYKMNDGDYIYMFSKPNSKWCDQPDVSPFGLNPPTYNMTPPLCTGYDYIVLPKNKEGIVVLNYSIYDHTGLDNLYTSLEVWENGITQLNSTFIGSANLTPELKTLIIPSVSYDRNITVFASWKWYTPVPTQIPATNITIYKFQFYTLDINEMRTDWTNNYTYELEKYCGIGSNYRSGSVPIFNSNASLSAWLGDSYFLNGTAFGFGYDSNGLNCGFIYLRGLTIARKWQYENAFLGYNNYNCYTGDSYFQFESFNSAFVAFFEKFLRNQVKLTLLYTTNSSPDYQFYAYNDIFNTTIKANSFTSNYSDSFRQTIDLINNSNIEISNQNPSGTKFYFVENYNNETILISQQHKFFVSNIQLEDTGWYCSDITNTEKYILYDGTIINEQYCGDVGCNAEHTHCNFHFVGTYCENNYDWVYSDSLGVIDSGSCPNNSICMNQTNGIICYDNTTKTNILCLDIHGAITNCEDIENLETSTSVFINPMNALALLIGGTFGYGTTESLATAQNITSILISLSVAMSLIIVITVKSEQRMNANNMFFLFIFSMLGLLIMFTLISWFPSWIMIVLIVISAIGFIKMGVGNG